jgi:hypothetical protein
MCLPKRNLGLARSDGSLFRKDGGKFRRNEVFSRASGRL